MVAVDREYRDRNIDVGILIIDVIESSANVQKPICGE
jgi:hypothetical protein